MVELNSGRGGTAANVASILAFLGWRASLAGQTGDDLAGDVLLRDLRSSGVETAFVHRPPGMQTPRLIHEVSTNGHAYSFRCPTCGQSLPRSRPLTLDQARQSCTATIHPPDVYFFDRVNPATLFLAEHFSDRASTVVYEPSGPVNAEWLQRALAVANIVKHSDDRALGEIESLGEEPRENQIWIVTHGVEGLEVRRGGGTTHALDSIASPAVDSAGAGDWTTAGLLYHAILKGSFGTRSIVEGLRFGQALAALNCTLPGARGLMRLSRRTAIDRAKEAVKVKAVKSRPRTRQGLLPGERATKGMCHTCLLPKPVGEDAD